MAAILRFAATEVVPRLAGTAAEIEQVLRALDGRFIAAGPSGSPLRGLVNVLPTGRNFYSVDPKAVPSRLAWETGAALADSLLARYKDDFGDWPKSVGLSVWGTSAMRTAGDDIAEVLALLGIRPQWDDASRRVTGLEPMTLEELGRPRIDVTIRISGFFRDAFPHVVTMLDDAVRLAASLDEPAENNYVRAHAQADLAEHGDERRSTTRVFGSKPGTYGAGLLQLIDSRAWRTDADLAQVYTAWGGFAYGRGLDGAPASDDMQRQYRRIAVAAKNTDTREHDIADSDDYFQYHGGMVATVRALTGRDPAAYIGDNTRPEAVRTRSLSEETTRVFRARVTNPRWMAAMRRHGYKGAFEMAATVDYLFGYDATAGVMADWMYERLTEQYVFDDVNRKFMAESNPWALHGMAERLLEAVSRGMWAQPAARHRRRAEAGAAGNGRRARRLRFEHMPTTFAEVAQSKYILLTTFTKDGRPKPTPIWAAPDGDRLLVITEGDSWKVKRIRNTPRVTLAACDVKGNPKSEAVDATATILDKSQNGLVYDAIGKRYGVIGKVFNLFSKYVRGGMTKNVGLELKAA